MSTRKYAITFPKEGRTKQSEAASCDINRLVKQYETTGQMNHVNSLPPKFGDFSEVGTFHEGMLLMKEAERAFMGQPAELRKRFHNDPGELIDFLGDEENLEEARDLGLVEPEPAEAEPVLVRTIEPTGEETGEKPPEEDI